MRQLDGQRASELDGARRRRGSQYPEPTVLLEPLDPFRVTLVPPPPPSCARGVLCQSGHCIAKL